MFDKLEIFEMAGAMSRHAAARQAETARNIANADTPGYKARDVAPFAQTYRDQSGDMPLRTTRSGHFAPANSFRSLAIAGAGSESPNGNNVSLETEIMKAAEIRSEHDRALAIYQSSLGILRASLGRR
jgi:flagellar basal-body rod protein FlgB